MIKLHYAEGIELDKEIVEIDLATNDDLILFVRSLMAKDRYKIVYIFTSDFGVIDDENDYHSKEVIVESDLSIVYLLISNQDYSDCDIHLHEYGSFEDAYAVALDMRESNPLCYNKQ